MIADRDRRIHTRSHAASVISNRPPTYWSAPTSFGAHSRAKVPRVFSAASHRRRRLQAFWLTIAPMTARGARLFTAITPQPLSPHGTVSRPPKLVVT